MLSFQKGKPYAASWPCDEAPRSNILRGSKTSNARTGSLYSIWVARMVALPKWRWAYCATKRKERISSASFSNLAWPTKETAASCYARSSNYAIILRKPKPTTKPKSNFFSPEVSALPKVSRAHENCKTVCEDSCKLRNGLVGYWTTPATQQFGFGLRCVGKLETRLPP